MKKALCHVILSEAKNLREPPDWEGHQQILRCAQNDMGGHFPHAVLLLLNKQQRFPIEEAEGMRWPE